MVNIRLAKEKDAKALGILNLEFNGVSIDEDKIQKSLNINDGEKVVVAEVGGALVGFGCIRIFRSFCYKNSMAEITEIYVSEGFRRRAIASQIMTFLLDIAEDECEEVFVRTNSTNKAGMRLFSKFLHQANHKVYRKTFIPKDGSVA